MMSRRLRRYRGWIAATVLVAIGGTVFAFYRQADTPESATSYQTEAAAVGTISVTVSGTGNVEVDGTTEVYPDAAGTVSTVEVAEGDLVTTGTVLFTLDPTDAEAKTAQAYSSYAQAAQGVKQAQASLEKAKATLADLKRRYEDQQTAATAASNEAGASEPTSPTAAVLSASSAQAATPDTQDTATTTDEVTQADIDSAAADVESAEAAVSSAKAQLSSASITYEQAQEDKDDLSVASPCSGRVYSLDIEEGDAVSASAGSSSSGSSSGAGATGGTSSGTASTASGAPIVIAPQQPLVVHLTVNEVDLPSLRIGQRAEIEFDALPDLMATGKVYEIADEGTVSSGVVTFDVWVSLDVADEALRPGMSTAAAIITDIARDALIVSNSAVKTNDDGTYYVEVLDDGATEPKQVTVEVGLVSSTQTQILSGLEEGDVVVTSSSSSSSDSSGDSGAPAGGMMMMGGMGGGPRE